MPHAKSALSLAAFLIFTSSNFLVGQTSAFQVHGMTDGGLLGQSISKAGDVNGDGIQDVLVRLVNQIAATTTVRVYSGADGSTLFSNTEATPIVITPFGLPLVVTYGVTKCGVGDIDADGFGDFAIPLSSSFIGEIRVYSGATGAVIRTLSSGQPGIHFSSVMGCIGDVNQDGHKDIAALVESDGFSAPSLYIVSPVDSVVLFVIHDVNFGSIQQIENVGDVNDDGVSDFIVGPTAPVLATIPGAIQVRSGADGALIHAISGSSNADGFGLSVCGSGDLNGDGVGDFIVGAPFADVAGTNAGQVKGFSGSDGSILHTIEGSAAGSFLGSSVSAAGDVNGDGLLDFAAGAPSDLNGEIRVFSGADSSLIYSVAGASAGDGYGTSVVGLGDVSGDGFADLAVGAPGSDVGAPNGGTLDVIHSETLPVLSFGTSTGLPHFLTQSWLPEGGDSQAVSGTITCTGANPFGQGLAYVSLAPDDSVLFGYLPILVDGSPTQLVSVHNFGFGPLGVLSVSGSRLSPALAGTHLYIQFFQAAPLVLSSNGLRYLMQ